MFLVGRTIKALRGIQLKVIDILYFNSFLVFALASLFLKHFRVTYISWISKLSSAIIINIVVIIIITASSSLLSLSYSLFVN